VLAEVACRLQQCLRAEDVAASPTIKPDLRFGERAGSWVPWVPSGYPTEVIPWLEPRDLECRSDADCVAVVSDGYQLFATSAPAPLGPSTARHRAGLRIRGLTG
jgi:hypothetical protein